MGTIDSDYLWLQERSQPSSRWRRTTLFLLVLLTAGAVWLAAASTSRDSGADPRAAKNPAQSPPRRAAVDTPQGSQDRRSESAATSADPRAQSQTTQTDIALSTAQLGPDAFRAVPTISLLTLAEEDALGKTPLTGIKAYDRADKNLQVEAPTPLDVKAREAKTATPEWHSFRIRAGDTLSIAFSRNSLSYADSLRIAHMPEYGDRFTRGLKAGDTLRVKASRNGRVLALDYPLGPLRTLEVRPGEDGFVSDVVFTDVEHRKAYATGIIDTSFYVDALDAGLSDNQIMKLVKIFGWDIDFVMDTRPGDRFVVVYDELYRDGKKVAEGNILAASVTSGDNAVRAVRYTGADNETRYYAPNGRAMKKAFIRTPVDYTRISSGFNLSRKHPILNRIRRHEGTDYAAPSGTPIKAAGNGRIVFHGRRGGYGNMIVIRHDSHLSTRYGHMSGFSNDFGVGSKVKQGDVIGYVGMSGLATGPHLHYEFRVDGEPKDPEKYPLPKAMPLPESRIADFKRQTAPLLSQLDTLSRTSVARAETDNNPLSR